MSDSMDGRAGSGGVNDGGGAGGGVGTLAERIAAAALLRGEFTLRSGRKSSYYLDKFRLLTDPSMLGLLGRELAGELEQVETELPGGAVDRLAGAVMGGVPLAAATSLVADRPTLFVRDANKGYGTGNRVEGVFEAGERVMLIEDVATTAGAAIEAAGVLREAGLVVEGVICVVDREEGARANAEAAGLLFRALVTKTEMGVA